METWREIRKEFEKAEARALGIGYTSAPPIIWDKLIEMEERLEELETARFISEGKDA